MYFKPGLEGAAQKASFANSLSNYRESGTDIMSFVRWSIYCQVKAAGDQYPAAIVPCARTSACNREDDEWALFKTLYYSARQELRNNSTGCNSNNLFPGAAAALSTENPTNTASPPTETPAGFFQISNSNGNVAVQYTGAQTIPADVTVQYFAVDGTNEISGGDGGQVLFMKGNPPGTIKTINGKAALVYIIDFARVNLTHPYYSKTRRNYNGISLAGVTGALQGNTAAGINASAMATMVGECNESCEQNADGWMQKLAGCNLDISSEAYIQIREGLLAVCKSSCQVNVSDHPFGASSSGTGTTTGDKNFRDVLQRVLGNEKFSAVCNDLLVDYPPAVNVHPLYVNESVRSLQPCSYAALQSWKQAWLLHPEFSSFADFIKIYIDPDFSLSNGQLTSLQSAFENNCITPQPLRLPASLSCTGTQAKTCLTCSELLDVKLNFSTAFPYIAADDPEYYTLLAKYVNRTFNFNLSSVDVFDALAHCNETSVSATDTIVPGLFSAAYQQFQQLQPGYFTNPASNIGADSLYRNYLTLWLNTALHRQLNFDYYKQYATGNGIRFDYPDSHVTPGCDSNTAFVNCAAKFITCCEPFEELEKFRKVFPDSVNARLLALYFSFLRTEWCSPVNLPAINYNVPYDSIVAYFSHFQLADGYTVTVRPDSLIEYTVSTNSSCHAVALNFLKDISSSGGTLRYAVCNKPLQPSVAIDDNACISLQVNTATSNAHSDYLEYIETTRRDYRNAYYTKCLSITPRLTLQALYNEPLEYHYTLYYYDQAGNLVKTIPPAGVVPVDIATDGAEKMQRIKNFRLADRDNCFEYGDAAGMNGTASITIRDNPLIQQAAAPFTIESFVKFTSLEGEQVLLAKQSVNALDNKLDGYRFYLNAGRLRFDLAAHGQEQWVQTISKITPYVWPNPYAALPPVNIRTEVNIPLERSLYRSISAQVSSDLSTLISSGEWVYLAVQYTADPNDPVRIFINGNLLSTELVSNKSEYTPAAAAPLSAAEIAAGTIETGFAYRSTTIPLSTGNGSSADFVIGAGTGGLSGSIKQVRLYNRVLPASEILNNATNTCLMPQSTGALVIWLPLNKELSAGVSVDRINQLPTVNNNTAFTAVYQPVYPAHLLPSHYFFNSLNAVTKQVNPDAGETNFFYDLPGRLMASQNAEQKISSRGEGDNRYSYTKFDLLGRVVETGEKSGAPVLTNLIAASDPTVSNSAVNRWLGSGTNTQIAQTIYDQPNTTVVRNAVVTGSQNIYNTSRKRVVAFVYRATAGSLADYSHATHYQYDISGNIKRLWQEYRQSATGEPVNMLKELLYDFDLVSGKVNQLTYQPGKGDQFIYRYEYDPENRLLRAYSGRDINTLQQDAGYRYYLHGPLARLELGDASTSRIVQGIDYTYTLQGWLKGVNGFQLSSSGLLGEADAGKDGSSVAKAGCHAGIAADALAYTLGYNANDYAPIGGVASSAFAARYQHPLLSATAITGKELFNGNISNATYATSGIDAGSTHGYSYGYDQLNRVMAVRSHNLDNIIPGSAWNNASVLDDYSEDFRYDPNGNLLHVLRNGTGKAGRNLAMDDMRYNYYYSDNNGERKTYIPGLALPADAWKLTNQLSHISDAVPPTNYPVAAFPAEKDIDDQRSNNYDYDEIGNLVKDQAEGISKINWTVYGKIQSITKTDGTRIEYEYDSGGNRILKRVVEGNTTFIDYYVRDAQGNNIALYSWKGATGSIPRPAADGNGIAGQVWAEQYLYGSTRLGMWKPNITVPPILDTKTDALQVGSKFFELSNHLGNVLAVISDRKIAVPASNNPTVTDHYTAEVISATDYTVFGMPMAGRQYNLTPSYRFGFNGKENDNEVKGSGSQQDYGMRVYDPRAGRFLTVDPIRAAYPMLTPYQFASNNPVSGIDQDGLEYSPAGKVGIFSIDQTAVQLYPDNPNIIIQQKANAPMVHLANEIARIHSQPVDLSSQWQPGSAFEKQRYEINKRAWYDRDGYNEDGSARPLTKLAGNKTWMALSANLAMPFFDFAAYADGEGEMLALLEVAAKNTSRETIAALVDKLLMSSGTIRSLDEKAVVGYRGSLATGTKFKTGAPFNPTDFDVDAFIVSDKLAKQIGNRSFRNGSSIKDLKDLSKDYEKIFKQIPGYRTSRNKPFTFRVFTNEEFNTKVKLTGFKTF